MNAVDRRMIQEKCHTCGKKGLRGEMKHIQTGFSVVWKHKKCPK